MKLSKKPLALLSVFSKEGIVEFAQALVDMGWEILASGGTADKLVEAGIKVIYVSEWVGGGSILNHKVVTLSREIHAGILVDLGLPEEMAEIEALGLRRIDLVCCDFYPIQEAIDALDATTESVIKKTDIGGPTMVSSGAKAGIPVICCSEDRQTVIDHLQDETLDMDALIANLRVIAETMVAKYRLASAMFHSQGEVDGIVGTQVFKLPKGENETQTATYFSLGTDDPLALEMFKQVRGSKPSLVGMCDLDRALTTLTHMAASWDMNMNQLPYHFPLPNMMVIVKHGNACGAAWKHNALGTTVKAIAGDPQAAFGGLVIANFIITEEVALELLYGSMLDGQKRILAGIVAPSFTPEALKLLKKKGGKRCGLWINPALLTLDRNSLDTSPLYRSVRGGYLKQSNYNYVPVIADLDVQYPDSGEPESDQLAQIQLDLSLAQAIGRTGNSNTITLVLNGMLIGNGVGQQARNRAAELAIKLAKQAGHSLAGASAYSDSFIPFLDTVEELAKVGIIGLMTSSGSKIGDKKVFPFCKENGMTVYSADDSIMRGFYGH